jgi:hypothetical protein
VKTLEDLIKEKNRMLEEHWNDKLTFNRDEVWDLFALIEKLEMRVSYLEGLVGSTLAGAVARLREKN